MALLGGCDAKVKSGKWRECNKCRKSSACSSVFDDDTGWYWTASSYANDATYAWYVSFNYGNVSSYGRASTGVVRCVRGGP